MEELHSSKKNLTARDHALMANAYRIRGKWQETVQLLSKHAPSFPAELKPYSDMTLLLGLENIGQTEEALKLAVQLEKTAPAELRYYVAYAQYRLLGDRNPEESGRVLKKMLENSPAKERKIFTLSRMIKLPGDQSSNAVKLLDLQPTNKAAYDILSKLKKPWSANVNLAAGYYVYLKNDNKTAIALLGAVPQKSQGWRKATYYRAYALYKLQRYAEALKLWGNLASSGNSYAESSVRRVGTLAGKAEKAAAVALLRKVAAGRKGNVQARALFVLSGLVEEAERKTIEDELIRGYPDSLNSVKVLWKRGWECWDARRFNDAVWHWKRAYSPGLDSGWRPRVLYWIAAAQKAAGNPKESEKTLDELLRKHPLSVYSFWARPGALNLADGDLPELKSEPDLLEQWGFVLYAKMRLQRPKATAKELYRSVQLSEWLGEDGGSYDQARLLTRYFSSGTTLYRKGLEYLYPRPFKKQVDAASGKYGVESNLVWSVMRQESAFKPNATSWAGASGLMQLMPGTAKDEAKRVGLQKYDIYAVEDNIVMGASHLAWLGRSFDRADWIMAAYNAGSGNARKWLAEGRKDLSTDLWVEEVRFDETCDYVQRVSGNLEVYRMLYGIELPASADVK